MTEKNNSIEKVNVNGIAGGRDQTFARVDAYTSFNNKNAPCPHCGGKAYTAVYMKDIQEDWAKCEKCGKISIYKPHSGSLN